ncbi:MAG: hypothetical protein mread185_000251 [Mycoplasmataceae bacterium]|nr:MAG: hypothetical protein mread185_000251 [Mycoplasmataceae bacterium]
MEKFKNYLENNIIKSNLTEEQLLELKELLIEQGEVFLFNRSRECYLLEIDRRLE